MISINELYLAATLLAYGAKLEDIDKTDKKRQKFIFSEDPIEEIWVQSGHSILRIENPNIETIKTKFIAGVLVFPPNFVDAIRKVKSAIHGV